MLINNVVMNSLMLERMMLALKTAVEKQLLLLVLLRLQIGLSPISLKTDDWEYSAQRLPHKLFMFKSVH